MPKVSYTLQARRDSGRSGCQSLLGEDHPDAGFSAAVKHRLLSSICRSAVTAATVVLTGPRKWRGVLGPALITYIG